MESYMYLGILEKYTLRQMEMMQKTRNEFLKRMRKIHSPSSAVEISSKESTTR